MALLVGLLILNIAISFFNAYSVGRSWADTKAIGGWQRFMAWCGATMSASGFTWCYTIIIFIIAGSAGWLSPKFVRGGMELGYVIVIFPILGSGLAIWLDSVTTAYRTRRVSDMAVAGWNTFAQVHNTYEAFSGLGDIFKDIGKVFGGDSDSDDKDGAMAMLALLLVLLALSGGVLTTAYIIRWSARSYAREIGAGSGIGLRARTA
jgi:hypothetical protein